MIKKMSELVSFVFILITYEKISELMILGVCLIVLLIISWAPIQQAFPQIKYISYSDKSD